MKLLPKLVQEEVAHDLLDFVASDIAVVRAKLTEEKRASFKPSDFLFPGSVIRQTLELQRKLGYVSPPEYGYILDSKTGEKKYTASGTVSDVNSWVYLSALTWALNDYPSLLIDDDLLLMLGHTDLPNEEEIRTEPLPHVPWNSFIIRVSSSHGVKVWNDLSGWHNLEAIAVMQDSIVTKEGKREDGFVIVMQGHNKNAGIAGKPRDDALLFTMITPSAFPNLEVMQQNKDSLALGIRLVWNLLLMFNSGAIDKKLESPGPDLSRKKSSKKLKKLARKLDKYSMHSYFKLSLHEQKSSNPGIATNTNTEDARQTTTVLVRGHYRRYWCLVANVPEGTQKLQIAQNGKGNAIALVRRFVAPYLREIKSDVPATKEERAYKVQA